MKVRTRCRVPQRPVAQAAVRRLQHRRNAQLDLPGCGLGQCRRSQPRLQRPTRGTRCEFYARRRQDAAQERVELAVAALRPLLDDDRVIRSSGSREATYGNGFKYRVKDLAAFFVASIRKLPFAVGEDPAVRDRAIAAL